MIRRWRDPRTVPGPEPLFPSKWGAIDVHAWHFLAPLATRYVPWGLGALRPSGLVAVLNDIAIRRRQFVVELGGGISTLFVARLLRERGVGRLVSIEHDESWARWLVGEIKGEGLDAQATVVLAELEAHSVGIDGNRWYSVAAIRSALGEQVIDLLLIDGPPAAAPGQGLVRYPAVPVLREQLAPDVTIVLDDIGRPGEQEIVRRWEAETEFRFQRRHFEGGIAIGMRGHEPLFP